MIRDAGRRWSWSLTPKARRPTTHAAGPSSHRMSRSLVHSPRIYRRSKRQVHRGGTPRFAEIMSRFSGQSAGLAVLALREVVEESIWATSTLRD